MKMQTRGVNQFPLQRFTSKKDLKWYAYLRFPRPAQLQKNREFITKSCVQAFYYDRECQISDPSFHFLSQGAKGSVCHQKRIDFLLLEGGGRTQAIDWLIDRQMSTIFYSLS